MLLNPSAFDVMWNGSPRSDGLRFRGHSSSEMAPVASVFGSGIVTWRVPYLFRTPPGFDLIVRGPTNQVKPGAVALDGLVETDWAVATFTMNWKITAPLRWIRFDAGEQFCMILPSRRDDLEAFRPEIRDLDDDPDVANGFREWAAGRERFVFDRMAAPPEERGPGWQKDYFKGQAPGGASAREHRVKLALRNFAGSAATRSEAGTNTKTWEHYAERSAGLGAKISLAARFRRWARFWVWAILR